MSDAAPPPPTLAPGATLGRFRVVSLLGAGSTAHVYAVRHRALGTAHAVKLLHSRDPALRDRLLGEARLQALLRHPHIVAVSDVIEHEGFPGLVMELIEGQTLEAHLRDQGPLAIPVALAQMDAILDAMAFAHAAGVLHRDLKPANVLLRAADGAPLLTDFGIAKALSKATRTGQTRTGTAMGTPGYMAPEQWADATGVDARADVFALGAILYELLAGRPPFAGDSMMAVMRATLDGRYPPIPDLPPALTTLLARCLDPDPAARFADAAALRAALADAAASPQDAAAPTAPGAPAAPFDAPTAPGAPAAPLAEATTAPRASAAPFATLIPEEEPAASAPATTAQAEGPTADPKATPAPSAVPAVAPLPSPAPAAPTIRRRWPLALALLLALGSAFALALAYAIWPTSPPPTAAPPPDPPAADAEAAAAPEAPVAAPPEAAAPPPLTVYVEGGPYPLASGRTAAVAAFWIDRTEVDRARWEACHAAGRCRGRAPKPDEAGLPVVNIGQAQAAAFCAWAGGRLPSEVEWDKAASWDGSARRGAPWGEAPLDCDHARTAACGEGPGPADALPASGSAVGALQMVGNVWEWTSTIGEAGRKGGVFRKPTPDRYVLRGGAYDNASPTLRSRRLAPADEAARNTGLRCVYRAEPKAPEPAAAAPPG